VVVEKGGRRRREEGGLPGIERVGGLTSGARCDRRWGGQQLALVAAGRRRSRGSQRRVKARGWNC